MDSLIEVLRSSIGISIPSRTLQEIVEYLSSKCRITNGIQIQEEVLQLLLVSNLRVLGCSSLPTNIQTLHNKKLAGPFLLQMDDVTNIASNQENRKEEKGNRMLKMLFSDGSQQIIAIEHRKIPSLSQSLPKGVKVVVWDVLVRRGVLLLNEFSISVLGGSNGDPQCSDNPQIRAVEQNSNTIPDRRTPISTTIPQCSVLPPPLIAPSNFRNTPMPPRPSDDISRSGNSLPQKLIAPSHPTFVEAKEVESKVNSTYASKQSNFQNISSDAPKSQLFPPRSTEVIDLIGSPSPLPKPIGHKPNIYSLDDCGFDYDVDEIKVPTQPIQNNFIDLESPKKKSYPSFETKLSVQNMFQASKKTDEEKKNPNIFNSSYFDSIENNNLTFPPKYPSNEPTPDDRHQQLSGESLSSSTSTSQLSTIAPFVISPDINLQKKFGEKNQFSLRDHFNSEPQRRRIKDILGGFSKTLYFYIEGSTVGIDAFKIEFDPISQHRSYYVIILFEETENSEADPYPLLVDPELCTAILNMTPDEYSIMSEKLTTKRERKEFKMVCCTKFSALTGKFSLNTQVHSDQYVGILQRLSI